MLQKPDVHTKRILDLADFIEELSPERFLMSTWGMDQEPRCICGWFMHNNARMEKDDWREAARLLGLDEVTASHLFSDHRSRYFDNKQAAKTLRHLAVTGEFKV